MEKNMYACMCIDQLDAALNSRARYISKFFYYFFFFLFHLYSCKVSLFFLPVFFPRIVKFTLRHSDE